jgi:hypothetical protein
MSKTDIALFDSYARDVLDGLGYEVDSVSVPGWRKKLAKLKVMLKRLI